MMADSTKRHHDLGVADRLRDLAGASFLAMTHGKEPLYRRVNTRTRGVMHGGGEYRWSRHAGREDRQSRGAMRRGKRHGLDYTPLFRFLLARVGREWDGVYREAVSRLDRPDPIFWLVARSEAERQPFVRIGETAYFSGLFVDDCGGLRLVDSSLRIEDMTPSCACCTHTLNGIPFTRRYAEGSDGTLRVSNPASPRSRPGSDR